MKSGPATSRRAVLVAGYDKAEPCPSLKMVGTGMDEYRYYPDPEIDRDISEIVSCRNWSSFQAPRDEPPAVRKYRNSLIRKAHRRIQMRADQIIKALREAL